MGGLFQVRVVARVVDGDPAGWWPLGAHLVEAVGVEGGPALGRVSWRAAAPRVLVRAAAGCYLAGGRVMAACRQAAGWPEPVALRRVMVLVSRVMRGCAGPWGGAVG